MELYYYTSTDAMQYILTNCNMYATNIRYMNDSEEYINGLNELYRLSQDKELLKKWITNSGSILDDQDIQHMFSEQKLKDNMREMELYSISFCKKNDLLSQWAIYAKESGVSIKMNFEKERYSFYTDGIDDSGKDDKVKAEWDLTPREVYYFTRDSMYNSNQGQQRYEETAYSILGQLYSNDYIDLGDGIEERWRHISAYVKRYDFYQEEEYRLVFEPESSVYSPCVKYRTDKNVLKPYLDIICKDGWPVYEIMVGPGFNQEVVYDSIKHFLDHNEITIGCKTIEDYANRVMKYFEGCPVAVEECRDFVNIISDYNWLKNVQFNSGTDYIFQKTTVIVDQIIEDKADNSEKREYFTNNYFSRSGVILTRSSIPYIF